MQSTVQLVSLLVILVAGLLLLAVEVRAKRPISAAGGACLAAFSLFQLVQVPWSIYVSLAFSIAYAALIIADAWQRREQIRDSFVR